MIHSVGRPMRDRKTQTELLEMKTTKSTLDGMRGIKHSRRKRLVQLMGRSRNNPHEAEKRIQNLKDYETFNHLTGGVGGKMYFKK